MDAQQKSQDKGKTDTKPTNQDKYKKTEITFPNGNRAQLVAPPAGTDAADILNALGIEQPEALIMITGGAANLDRDMKANDELRSRLVQLFSRGVARAAVDIGALIIDGGTHSGVMALMGQGVADRGRKSSLLGVAPTGKVTYPGGPAEGSIEDGAPLDPNHSHFVLVQSDKWGGETDTMYELAEALANRVLDPPPPADESSSAQDGAEASPAKIPVVTVLASGGLIAKDEVLRSVRQGWPIIVVQGSGRLADRIAKLWKKAEKKRSKCASTADPVMAEITDEGSIQLFPMDGPVAGLEQLVSGQLRRLRKDPALEDAWKRFADYDHNAKIAQKRSLGLQKWILGLGVAATFLAVSHSILKPVETPWIAQANGYLRYLVILMPIVVSILQAGAAKFKGGANYILLRGSAEALKRQIYRYRAQVGIYSPEETKTEPREVKLARKVKTVGGQLMKTEANQGSLKPYQGQLPPHYEGPEDDDGFSDLDAEEYLTWRLEDQLKWYRSRTERFDKQLRRFHWLILSFGGVGTFLAAIGLEIWIAVTVALAGALSSFLELKQVEATLLAYNQATTDLGGIRIWWHALPREDRTKQENKEKLVMNTETVLQTELAGWVQEMRDALAELYEEAEASGEATASGKPPSGE